MVDYRHVTLEMTPDGKFRRVAKLSLGTRLVLVAVVAAVVAGALALAVFILGLALALVPVMLIAAGVAYVAFRIELWRARRSVRGQRNLFRP